MASTKEWALSIWPKIPVLIFRNLWHFLKRGQPRKVYANLRKFLSGIDLSFIFSALVFGWTVYISDIQSRTLCQDTFRPICPRCLLDFLVEWKALCVHCLFFLIMFAVDVVNCIEVKSTNLSRDGYLIGMLQNSQNLYIWIFEEGAFVLSNLLQLDVYGPTGIHRLTLDQKIWQSEKLQVSQM